ncbi:hypothetical protein [Streptomyces sp. NPDC053079]|uniref:hypothetical protein n=1 Tax=Streptomyces sp. NPDC053079 TaxID=3365697 RepID=UPI0037D353BB
MSDIPATEAYPPRTAWRIQAWYPTGWGTVSFSFSSEGADRALAWHCNHEPEVQHRLVKEITTSTVVKEADDA